MWVRISLWENEPGFLQDVDVLPSRVLPEEGESVIVGDRAAVVREDRNCGEFKNRVSRPFEFLGGDWVSIETTEYEVQSSGVGGVIYNPVKDQTEVAAYSILEVCDEAIKAQRFEGFVGV